MNPLLSYERGFCVKEGRITAISLFGSQPSGPKLRAIIYRGSVLGCVEILMAVSH